VTPCTLGPLTNGTKEFYPEIAGIALPGDPGYYQGAFTGLVSVQASVVLGEFWV